MLPLKIKMISTRFLLIFYNHCKKQTIKFIYCFSIWSYFAIIRILTQNIFDKTVLLLNFTILRKALTQQNCNALVTGTGLIRESCIYSMELFVYQEVDSVLSKFTIVPVALQINLSRKIDAQSRNITGEIR